MDAQERLLIESNLVDRLWGRFKLLQSDDVRRSLIEQALREVFEDEAGRFLDAERELSEAGARTVFITEFLSYGVIQELLGDLAVEDIIVNSIKPIYIHHAQKGLVNTGKQFDSIEELELFIKKLVLLSGRKSVEKIMNIELPNLEGRVNIVDAPFGPQLTITKAKSAPMSILDMVAVKALSYEVAAQLWLYLEGMSLRPANLIIAGGPGVGKTTLLNALFSFIPDNERIVVIEDTLELNTDFDESCSRLESGEDFSLADLVKNSLRMRPERIVIGEVRGEEAQDMMTAANIGKYCIGTIHALSCREAIVRLQNQPMNIPEELIRLVDVFIVLKRFHVEGAVFRVVDEVSETSGMEQEKVLLSQIYKYDYESKTLKGMATSTVFRDRLAEAAGLLPKDIILEVQLRAFLLEELAKRGHTTLKEISLFCNAYRKDPEGTVTDLGFNLEDIFGKGYMKERRKRRPK